MGSTGLSLADLPNIIIMIAAVIALFIMLVILLRNMEVIGIVGEGVPEDAWRRTLPPSRLLMQRVHIPFTFKLQENCPASYSELNCSVTSSVRYWQGSWWGAPVRELHSVLWGPFSNLENSFRVTRDGPHDEKCIKLHGEPLQLGPPPRGSYPLVVVLARDGHSTDDLRPDDTVALISVIHIQDDQCSLPTGVIAQYLKQANGHLSCLKQLYMSAEGELENGYNATALCCVCASNPLSRALLPCRHACLCHACLPKLDKCPICRSNISSYFCIRNEEDLKQQNFPFNSRLLNLFHYHWCCTVGHFSHTTKVSKKLKLIK